MKETIPVFLLAMLMAACMPVESRLTSRAELERAFANSPENKNDWYYCGTEAGNHHFLTRVGGNSRSFIVPGEQIKLPATTPLPPPGLITIRQVDPGRNFSFGPGEMQWSYHH